jgi:hypothetical protein
VQPEVIDEGHVRVGARHSRRCLMEPASPPVSMQRLRQMRHRSDSETSPSRRSATSRPPSSMDSASRISPWSTAAHACRKRNLPANEDSGAACASATASEKRFTAISASIASSRSCATSGVRSSARRYCSADRSGSPNKPLAAAMLRNASQESGSSAYAASQASTAAWRWLAFHRTTPVQHRCGRVRRPFEKVRPGLGNNIGARRSRRQDARFQEGNPRLLVFAKAGTGEQAIDDRRGFLLRHLTPKRLERPHPEPACNGSPCRSCSAPARSSSRDPIRASTIADSMHSIASTHSPCTASTGTETGPYTSDHDQLSGTERDVFELGPDQAGLDLKVGLGRAREEFLPATPAGSVPPGEQLPSTKPSAGHL